MDTGFYVVYMSPNKSTQTIADVFADHLAQKGQAVERLDLTDPSTLDTFNEKLAADENPCLLIGSPVYKDMAVPPVMNFIDSLPKAVNAWAVPFVTWGKACSGVALWQMGNALEEKGFQIAGAAKVVAVHCMMWDEDQPEGQGHPDDADKQMVMDLADQLITQMKAGSLSPLPLADLDYQPEERAKEGKEKLEKPYPVMPKTINEETCTQCGTCEEECPAGAISLNPYPEFGDACFDCFTCVRTCPENAVEPKVPMAKIAENIRKRVSMVNEQPLTQIFVNAAR